MNWKDWLIVALCGIGVSLTLVPFVMYLWGTMFGKGFFSNIKHKKQNTDEYEENK